VDRATKIRRAIKTVIAGFSPFSDAPHPDHFAVIGRERAALISDAIFGTLDEDGYLNADPATDKQIRITFVITAAIGHIGDPPDDHSPGRWWAQSRRPGWDLDEVADAIYANLVHSGYVSP
jgi:hypothetical protein